jgi:hypothetical protein
MLDGADLAFASALERWLRRELDGEEGRQLGLYRSLMGGDWDTVTRTRGLIFGYERVLEVMVEIAREMNEPRERAPHVMGRPN